MQSSDRLAAAEAAVARICRAALPDPTAGIGQSCEVLDPQQEAQLFSLIMDGLDDLYDQRFGWNGEEHRGEMWLSRLLIAVATSLGGSPWESELLRIARELQALVGSGLTPEALNDRALELTDHLRGALPYG